MNESQLAKLVAERIKRLDEEDNPSRIEYEVPYNHYGSRGVVDIVVYHRYSDDSGGNTRVIELKSDHAVSEATGANEILRQYNRMRRSFFEDERNKEFEHGQAVSFDLVFAPTVRCVNHVAEYLQMYRHIKSPKHRGGKDRVTFAIEPSNTDGVGGCVNTASIEPFGEVFMRFVEDGGRLYEAIDASDYSAGEVIGGGR